MYLGYSMTISIFLAYSFKGFTDANSSSYLNEMFMFYVFSIVIAAVHLRISSSSIGEGMSVHFGV
jgi:hypothetical protein